MNRHGARYSQAYGRAQIPTLRLKTRQHRTALRIGGEGALALELEAFRPAAVSFRPVSPKVCNNGEARPVLM